MEFKKIFDVSSRRDSQLTDDLPGITATFRNRVIRLCTDIFGDQTPSKILTRLDLDFWSEINVRLSFITGTPITHSSSGNRSQFKETVEFIENCDTSNFFDFLESIFTLSCFPVGLMGRTKNESNIDVHEVEDMVDAVNHLFEIDDLPYALTQLFFDRLEDGTANITYPKVIRRDHQLVYAYAIKPTFSLLQDNKFSSANNEFLKALEDYRKGDYEDCLVKCGSAFESTMKILCHQKGWSYNQTDTAQVLVKTVVKNSPSLEPFFDQPLMIVAMLRNKLGSAHGSGTRQRNTPAHLARYAINATAAAILLLVEDNA